MKECCNAFLMEQFGDQDVVKEIYEEYAKSIKEKIPEAEAALAAEEWVTLDHVAHAIKGNALATGDNDVANVAIAIRMANTATATSTYPSPRLSRSTFQILFIISSFAFKSKKF